MKYQNRSREALLQRVEFAASTRGDNFVFFHSNQYAQRQALRNLIEKNFPDIEVLSKTTLDGQHIVVARTGESPEEVIEKVQEISGETFTRTRPEQKEAKRDLIKLRGHIGVLAQFLMIASAFWDSDKQEKVSKAQQENKEVKNYYQTDDGQAKIWTSIYGFVGNGINSVYGVQKEMDTTRLLYAKKLINKGLTLRHGDDGKLAPKPTETRRTTPLADKPSFMEQHSIRVGSAIKLWSKKKLFDAKDQNLKLSAVLSIIGKVVSFVGLPEDHFQLEKKQDPITQMRRHSNFVSSLFDWTSTFSLFAGSFYRNKSMTEAEKKKAKADRPWYSLFDFKNSEARSKDNIQWWQLSGAVAFAASLYTKAIAPYTNKKLDVETLSNHASLAIASTVRLDHAEELTQLTSQLMQTRELPEIHEKGFAATFADIANRLEQHHDIQLHNPFKETEKEEAKLTEEVEKTQNVEMAEEQTAEKGERTTDNAEYVEGPAKEEHPSAGEVEKENKLAASIARNKPKEKLTERLVVEEGAALEPSGARF